MCEASVIVETALWQEMQSIRVRDLVMIQCAMQILRAKEVLEGSFYLLVHSTEPCLLWTS